MDTALRQHALRDLVEEGVDVAHRSDAEGARDGQSLEALFRLHYPRLVKTLCLITLDRETAADAAALEEAAATWNTITQECGLESQRAAYKRSLGLEL